MMNACIDRVVLFNLLICLLYIPELEGVKGCLGSDCCYLSKLANP
jgi:hypothetical protein